MKIVKYSLLILATVFLAAGCASNQKQTDTKTHSETTPVTKTDNFNKKIECAKLETDIKTKLNQQQRSTYKSRSAIKENNVLVKLFYSETYNSCLYAYVTEDAVDYSLYAKNITQNSDPGTNPPTPDLYKIANALTNELIFVDAKGNIYFDDFQKKISELEAE